MARRTTSSLPPDARKRIADALNARVADTYALYALAKTAHWNVEGHAFIGLHKFLDDLAKLAFQRADTMAERVMALGFPATGVLPAAVASSPVEVGDAEFAPIPEYVTRLLDAYETFGKGLRATRLIAIQMGDRETAAYLDMLIFDVEHDAALLAPHLPDDPPPSR
jgi:DNA-binding ferritin-like protein